MARGPAIDCRAAPSADILCDMRSDVALLAPLDEIARVVALVAAQRDPSGPKGAVVEHRNRRVAL